MGIADPMHLVDRINAIFLGGGSAFGLDAASGVMEFLAEQGLGFPTHHGKVPVVPTAILFDRSLGDQNARPTPSMAREAARNASTKPVVQGCVGAGTGATVGKLLTARCATKGGLGSWSITADDGLAVGVLAAVNAFGDVVDPRRRQIIAGARRGTESLELLDTGAQILTGKMRSSFGSENTTLVLVATNASLPGPWLARVAGWASDGLALCLRPAFSAVDGDVVIALSTDEVEAEPHRVGLMAQAGVVEAVLRAVTTATPLGGLPNVAQLEPISYE
jgi:L-aminopeptidase/D-esterase-like protein